MTSSVQSQVDRLMAFVRRDFKINWSYRAAFLGDLLNLASQVVMFFFIAKMVDPTVLPEYGGQQTDYLGFVAVGIALGAFIQLGMNRVSIAIRQEQLMGTLEPLYMTPTSMGIMQIGLAFYDFVYIPLRTTVLLGVMVVFLDVAFAADGLLPTIVMILFFIPFVWGLGTIAGAGILTFKRGGASLGLLALGLNVTSGAYFPLTLFPDWVVALAEKNPIAIAMNASRQALLGGQGWAAVTPHLPFMFFSGLTTLAVGWLAVRLALQRERRRGTLGAY